MLDKFLTSNETKWRLARTIAQEIIGVLVANADKIIGTFTMPAELKLAIYSVVIAILCPIMAELGKANGEVKIDK